MRQLNLWHRLWPRLLRLASYLPLLTILAILGAGLLLVANFAWSYFSDRIAVAEETVERRQIVRGGELTGSLFTRLVNDRIIFFDPANLSFKRTVDCGQLFAGISQGEENALAWQLCATDPGADIIKEIDSWNANVEAVAIRDNRNNGLPCNSNSGTEFVGGLPGNYVSRGCYLNAWEASLPDTSNGSEAFTSVDEGSEPEPQTYGFLARPATPGHGDWRRFSGQTGSSGTVLLKSNLEVEATSSFRKITLDHVGELQNAIAVPERSAFGLQPDSVLTMCENFRSNDSCIRQLAEENGQFLPRAGRVTFNLPDGWKGTIQLVVKPSRAVPASIRKLSKARFETQALTPTLFKNDTNDIRVSTHVLARCRVVNSSALIVSDDGESDIIIPYLPDDPSQKADVCTLVWEPSIFRLGSSAENDASDERLVLLRTGGKNGIALSAERPTGNSENQRTVSVANAAALDMGLAPVTGLDDRDQFGLLGQLRATISGPSTRELELTVDKDMQAGANEMLGGALLMKRGYEEVTDGFLADRTQDRRASFVLVDAGPLQGNRRTDDLTGRILAVATWPQPKIGLSDWDLRAMQAFRPSESPLAARAWSQNDRLYAPGSTFKLVVSLAAIERASNGERVVRAYLGADTKNAGLDALQIKDLIGNEFDFSFNATTMKLPVFRGQRLVSHATLTNRNSPVCSHSAQGGCSKSGRIGLVDMLAQSDNLYFARLALLMDVDAVSKQTSSGRVEIRDRLEVAGGETTLALASMAKHVWPQLPFSLLPEETISPFSRLFATPIQVDSFLPDKSRILTVSLNGIGQSAQATPLAIATISASIATGSVVIPRLSNAIPPTGQGEPLIRNIAGEGLQFEPLLAQELLATLRDGMKAVVTRGTAQDAFAGNSHENLRKRLWGKTGTAQTGFPEKDGNTVWFTGWVEGLNIDGYENRRVAFACMITHAKLDKVGGGSVCGPLSRMILKRLESPKSGGRVDGK